MGSFRRPYFCPILVANAYSVGTTIREPNECSISVTAANSVAVYASNECSHSVTAANSVAVYVSNEYSIQCPNQRSVVIDSTSDDQCSRYKSNCSWQSVAIKR